MKVTTEEDLSKALADHQNTIEIQGDLAQKSIKIKATGKVAWVVAVGAILIAITAILSPLLTPKSPKIYGSSGAIPSEPMLMSSAPTESLELSTIVAIVAIVVALIGIGVASLNKMRKYNIEEVSEDKVILKRK